MQNYGAGGKEEKVERKEKKNRVPGVTRESTKINQKVNQKQQSKRI